MHYDYYMHIEQSEGGLHYYAQTDVLASVQSAYISTHTQTIHACIYVAVCIATCMKSVSKVFRKDDLKK